MLVNLDSTYECKKFELLKFKNWLKFKTHDCENFLFFEIFQLYSVKIRGVNQYLNDTDLKLSTAEIVVQKSYGIL